MSNFRAVFIISLTSAMCLGAPPCFGAWFRSKVDAVSGATHSAKKKITLPPEGESYDISGVLPGLKNYVVKYDDNVYRGGDILEPSAGKTLRKLGVKTIISITPNEYEREFCREYKFELVEMPFKKDTGVSEEDVNRFLETIRTGEGAFYVHCYGGTHRAGILGAAYRIFILNWPVEKALEEYDVLGGDFETDRPMIEPLKRMVP